MDLALNNLQGLICHKTQQTKPNQTKPASPFNNPLVTVSKASITIGIIFTFIFIVFSIP